MTAVRVNLTALFDALAAGDEATVINEVAFALGEHIAPSLLAGRLAIPAALGDDSGSAVTALVAAGRIGDWSRLIPPGPEPRAERRQLLAPAVPLVAAALFAAPAIARGLQHPDPQLPTPLFPKDVKHPDGSWGALRAAFAAGDTDTIGHVLMGFYGSGTDYREISGSLYAAFLEKFSADPAALLLTVKATQALDFVDWGDRVPALIHWLIPLLGKAGPEMPGAQEVREATSNPARDLDFVRTRLALSKPEAAGATLRQTVARGSTAEVIAATFDALKQGANGTQVAAQLSVVAAENLATTPLASNEDIARGVIALRVANAARFATYQVQDVRVLPIVFQAANYVNQIVKAQGDRRGQPLVGKVSSPLAGGLIENVVLRNLRYQIDNRDEAGARSTVRRYTQMTFPARSLAGMLGLAAAQANVGADLGGRGMLAVQAAGEDFMALTPRQQGAEGVALIDAALHAIIAQNTDFALARRVEHAIGIASESE